MATLDDLLRFVAYPPPGDPSLTATNDQISGSVETNGSLANLSSTVAVGADLSSALQSELNSLTASADIRCSAPGTYLVNGALQSGSGGGATWNGQILFPAVATAHSGLTIRIAGTIPPVLTSPGYAVWDKGLVLTSNTTSGSVFAVKAATTGSQPQASQVRPTFEDMILNVPAGGSGIDAQNATAFGLARCILQQGTVTPTDGSFGLRLPGLGNGISYNIRDVMVNGFQYGYWISEFSVFEGEVLAQNCTVAMFCNGGNANKFVHLDTSGVKTIFSTVGAAGSTEIVADVTLQAIPAGGMQFCDLDPTNHWTLQGFVRLDTLQASKPAARKGMPAVVDPTNGLPLSIAYEDGDGVGSLGKHPRDNFQRICSAPSASALPGLCSDSLHGWRPAQGGGTFALSGGQLSSTNSGGVSQALLPVLDGIRGGRSRSVVGTFTTGATIGSTFFVVEAHHGYGTSTGDLQALNFQGTLYLKVNGSNVLNISGVFVGSTQYTIELAVLMGADGLPKRARVLVNGTPFINYWLSASQQAVLVPGTLWPFLEDGIYFQGDTTSYCTLFEVIEDASQGDMLVTATATRTAMHEETTVCTSGTFTVTLPPPVANVATPNIIVNTGSGTITVAPPSGTLTKIGGTTGNITLTQGQRAVIVSPDGTNFQQVG